MTYTDELRLLRDALDRLAEGAVDLPEFVAGFDVARAAVVLDDVATRMQDNYPYHHPLYAGQMLKPPDPVARIAYALSLWVNPNNHALDGGRASSAMEKECVAEIGGMFGWPAPLGHLTGGGTIANLEALWVAGRLRPGQKILASEQAHYTHSRLSDVLGLDFAAVRSDAAGRMDVGHLAELLTGGDVGTVVATLGTTGFGAVDPLPEILELALDAGARVHVDAAYGGYFVLAAGLDADARAAFDALAAADSIVVDPHKHGLQPYGCGCVMFRDPSVGRLYRHDSPYTYFSSAELHLGEISLECSRAGAAAVALWATQQMYPLVPGGEFAARLDRSLAAARRFYDVLAAGDAFVPLMRPELDIVVYAAAEKSASKSSALARSVFQKAAERHLHLALIEVPVQRVQLALPGLRADAATVTCLRSVLMKPEQADWVDDIAAILDATVRPARG